MPFPYVFRYGKHHYKFSHWTRASEAPPLLIHFGPAPWLWFSVDKLPFSVSVQWPSILSLFLFTRQAPFLCLYLSNKASFLCFVQWPSTLALFCSVGKRPFPDFQWASALISLIFVQAHRLCHICKGPSSSVKSIAICTVKSQYINHMYCKISMQ